MDGRTRDALNALIRLMDELNDDERLKVLDELRENYCQFCGSASGDSCTCMRDD